MFKNSNLFAVLVLCGGIAGECLAGTAVVIQPVGASGTHTIVGSDVFLSAGGQRVRLEFRIAGWGVEHLKTMQVRINAAGFDNGGVPIQHAVVPCPGYNSSGHAFCAQTFESGSGCRVECDPGSTVNCMCESALINKLRSDYVGLGLDHVSAVDLSSPNYRLGLTTSPPDYATDPGVSMYLGTIFLDVPAGAQGTYAIGLVAIETFMQSDGVPGQNDIPIELLTPARIIIGDPVFPGSRYVAYNGGSAGTQTAVRVMMKSLYHPGPPVAPGEDRDFTSLEGFVRWAGPPTSFPDNSPGGTIMAAQLQCTPHFADWGSLGTVQLYGDAVLPSSVYNVWQVPISCQDDPNNPACFGPVQVLHTGQWGDAAAPFARSDQAAQPDMTDIAVIIDGFRGILGAASKTLTQLQGASADPASRVNFIDVQFAVDGLLGMAYPYPVPAACP